MLIPLAFESKCMLADYPSVLHFRIVNTKIPPKIDEMGLGKMALNRPAALYAVADTYISTEIDLYNTCISTEIDLYNTCISTEIDLYNTCISTEIDLYNTCTLIMQPINVAPRATGLQRFHCTSLHVLSAVHAQMVRFFL